MKPIEPGCLAIIVNSLTPENIGKTVRVIEKVASDKIYSMPSPDGSPRMIDYTPCKETRWLVELEKDTVVVAIDKLGNYIRGNKGLCAEKRLMRIGDDSVQDVLKKVVENVE